MRRKHAYTLKEKAGEKVHPARRLPSNRCGSGSFSIPLIKGASNQNCTKAFVCYFSLRPQAQRKVTKRNAK